MNYQSITNKEPSPHQQSMRETLLKIVELWDEYKEYYYTDPTRISCGFSTCERSVDDALMDLLDEWEN